MHAMPPPPFSLPHTHTILLAKNILNPVRSISVPIVPHTLEWKSLWVECSVFNGSQRKQTLNVKFSPAQIYNHTFAQGNKSFKSDFIDRDPIQLDAGESHTFVWKKISESDKSPQAQVPRLVIFETTSSGTAFFGACTVFSYGSFNYISINNGNPF